MGTEVEQVPAWSGEFWENEGYGYLAVAWTDTRTHRPPEGWTLIDSHEDDEATTFCYRQTA